MLTAVLLELYAVALELEHMMSTLVVFIRNFILLCIVSVQNLCFCQQCVRVSFLGSREIACGYEHSLFFQRTWIPFSELTCLSAHSCL